MKPVNPSNQGYWNPYIAGLLLGLTLLASFLILGAGLGASGGIARIGAFVEGMFFPEHTRSSAYFGSWGESSLSYYLVFMFIGIILGGLLSAVLASRVNLSLEKGAAAPAWLRTSLALTGGILVGFASRLARGCTSGQALTGGAMLLTGSLLFLVCIFIGGYAMAYFVRSQWND